MARINATSSKKEIKKALKEIEKYLTMNGEVQYVSVEARRGISTHNDLMKRREANGTMTITIYVNGGADNVEYAPPGMI